MQGPVYSGVDGLTASVMPTLVPAPQNRKVFWRTVMPADVVQSGSWDRNSLMSGVSLCRMADSSILTFPFQSPCTCFVIIVR